MISEGARAVAVEGLLVAGTAPGRLASTRELGGSEAVGKVVVDCPGRLAGAHERRAPRFASILGVHIGKRVVALVTALDR